MHNNGNQSSGLTIQGGVPFNDPLKNVNFLTKDSIKSKETGRVLAKRIWNAQTGQQDNLNFFRARSVRWRENELWALGKQNMSVFLNYLNVNSADKAYVPIDMTPVMVGPQFLGTLVESMCKNIEYPCVTAIDAESMTEKEERQMDALFRMFDADNVNALQEAGGMQLEPADAYVPDNELNAKIYFELEDRLPKEVKFEKLLERTLERNKYQKVLKRENVSDFIVFNIGATKVERRSDGYNIKRITKYNLFYNFFQNDNGEQELSYVGHSYKLKVRELRELYGDNITEEQLYKLAAASNQYNQNRGALPTWQNQYQFYNAGFCPWDDYSIMVVDGEVNVYEPEYSVIKTDNFGNDNVDPKKSKPEPTGEKAKVAKTDKSRWYNFVYAPDSDILLKWGLGDVVITDYNDHTKSYSSYTVVIPGNNGEYIPSLFERSLEPLREYALAKLKRKQLLAKLRPTGIRIDVAKARDIDLGAGDTIPWLEVIRIYDQTGNEVYSSEGVDPNEPQGPALNATAPDDTVRKIIELTNVINSSMQEIRQLLGVPQYRDGADVGDRTAAKLADQQNVSSYNVTDFISNANNQLMEDTLHKICILEWQKIVKEEKESEEDLINTKFKVSVKMKLSEYERQLLERNIEKWSATIDGTGQPLLSPKDCFRIRNIENYKLAEQYLANVVEENRKRHIEESQMLQQQNAQTQMQSAQQAAELKKKELEMEADFEKQKIEVQKSLDKQMKMLELVNGLILENQKTGAPIPAGMQPLIDQVLQNVMIPIVADTQETQKVLVQKMQQEQAMAQQQQQMQNMSPEEQEAMMAEQQSQM